MWLLDCSHPISREYTTALYRASYASRSPHSVAVLFISVPMASAINLNSIYYHDVTRKYSHRNPEPSAPKIMRRLGAKFWGSWPSDKQQSFIPQREGWDDHLPWHFVRTRIEACTRTCARSHNCEHNLFARVTKNAVLARRLSRRDALKSP